MATAQNQIPASVSIRVPSKYHDTSTTIGPRLNTGAPFIAPPKDWLHRTWTVTHSTLKMWESKKNVRITYKDIPEGIDDLVEYEKQSANSALHKVKGIDKPDPTTAGAWDWRGKGLLKIASSHWEILGYGERPYSTNGEVERWVVTWFAPTLFTAEGIDIYCDRPEGISARTFQDIHQAMISLTQAPKFVDMAKNKMKPVQISLPWKTS